MGDRFLFSLVGFAGILLAIPALQLLARSWSALPDLSFQEWMWTAIIVRTLTVDPPGRPISTTLLAFSAKVTALPLIGLLVGWLLVVARGLD